MLINYLQVYLSNLYNWKVESIDLGESVSAESSTRDSLTVGSFH